MQKYALPPLWKALKQTSFKLPSFIGRGCLIHVVKLYTQVIYFIFLCRTGGGGRGVTVACSLHAAVGAQSGQERYAFCGELFVGWLSTLTPDCHRSLDWPLLHDQPLMALELRWVEARSSVIALWLWPEPELVSLRSGCLFMLLSEQQNLLLI